jgi:hypothetical protein
MGRKHPRGNFAATLTERAESARERYKKWVLVPALDEIIRNRFEQFAGLSLG